MEELFYTINKERSEIDNALVINIQIGEKSGLIHLNAAQNKPLTQDSLLRAASTRDSSILPFLIKEETEYRKKHHFLDKTTLFHIIRIPYNNTAQALKLFATSGRLYFNRKQITIDLFGKNEFLYLADTISSSPSIRGLIKSTTQEFDITSCDFICKGPPHWFIKGIILKFITTEITWKDFKSAFKKEFRPPPELIREAQQDPEAPRVIVSTTNFNFKEREPLPVLVLKDRYGAFADLWMDYSNGAPLILFQSHSNNVLNEEGRILYKRQPSIELEWEKDLLETDFIKKTVDSSHYYCPIDKVAKSIAFLLEIGWQVRDSKGNLVLIQRSAEFASETDSKTISIKGKIHYGTFEADLTTIAGAFNRRERFAQIATGHVALLPNSWEKTGLDALIEEGEIVGDSLRINKSQIGSLAELFEAQPDLKMDNTLKEMRSKLETFKGISTTLPGPLFQGSLRPYQQEGLNWLSFLLEFGFHGLLADDMGLGKTVQALAFLSRITLHDPVLIVMPSTLIFNWKQEIERFLPGIPYLVHHGEYRPQTIEALDKPQLILTTYATLRLDLPSLSKLTYTCIILDEAQAIKNAYTQTSQCVRQLKSRFRLSITGTPIENNLLELWSQFRFLIPDLFPAEESFKAEILAGASDPRFLKRIKKTTHPFLLRRRKEDVAKDLPEKIEQIVWVEMGESQRALYDEFLSGVKNNLIKKVNDQGLAKHRMALLEAILRLRQICCHPLLVSSQDNTPVNESAKLDALIADLETAILEGRKVLIYSQFTSMLSLIAKKLKENNWNFAYLDGSTQNREKVVKEFQENPAVPLFLISLKAGGTGLNLVAADYVFLYDPWWNNAVENQAIDRAHRIGRKDTIVAKRYLMLESIEEKILKIKAAKTSLASDFLDEVTVNANLSSEDLLFLLS